MSSLPPALLPCLLAAIALGCGSTTASGGGAADAVDANGDIAAMQEVCSDACCNGSCDGLGNDLGGQTPDSTTDSSATDATSDVPAGTDAASDTAASTCPPVLVSAHATPHGKTCSQDSDCTYGLCQKGGFLTGYNAALGYCTKDCGCSQATAQCSDDNIVGGSIQTVQFSCGFEVSQSGGNTLASDPPQKRCAMQCKADADCAAWNPALPHCIGSSKYVSSAGVCGFDPFK